MHHSFSEKDHLVKERLTLTKGMQTDGYAAAMEAIYAATENALFDAF